MIRFLYTCQQLVLILQELNLRVLKAAIRTYQSIQFTYSRLSHGQEKSEKSKKNDKSQVKMGFLKKVRKSFKKTSNFVSSNLQNSIYLKDFDW